MPDLTVYKNIHMYSSELGFILFCLLLGANEDNSTDHKGGVNLEEHHEAYSNMTTVLKTIDVPDELDWRDYGKR